MQRERNYGIDVLRGIALILIFIYHYYQFQGSYVGVIIFFALSGYLVTEGLLAENFDYWLYLKKKFIKLYPLLLLVVFVCTLGVFFLEKGLGNSYRYGAIAVLFAGNNIYQAFSHISYFEAHNDILPFVHTWALSLEMQFYIAYPLLILGCRKWKKNSQETAEIIFLFSSFSALSMFFHYILGSDLSRIYYGTDTRLFTFLLAGACSSYMKVEKNWNKVFFDFMSILALLLLLLFSIFFRYDLEWNYLGALYLISFFVTILTAACYRFDFLAYRNPISDFLQALGIRGYSYYLWQYPIMIFANEYFKWIKISYHWSVGIQVIVLILLSEVTYRFVEKKDFSFQVVLSVFFLTLALLLILPEANLEENRLLEQKIEQLSRDSMAEETKMEEFAKTEMSERIEKKEEKQILRKEEEYDDLELFLLGEEKEKEKGDFSQRKEGLSQEQNQVFSEQVTFIGDSVMKMCEGEIKRDFPNSYVDAVVSRQFFTLPGILEELKRKGKLSPIVVIHLGSNGRIPKKSFDKMVQLLEEHQVFLLNCVVSKSWEREVNQLLEQEISKHSNLHLIDWYQYAKGQSSWFYKDATHPKPNGAKKYSHFILKALKEVGE